MSLYGTPINGRTRNRLRDGTILCGRRVWTDTGAPRLIAVPRADAEAFAARTYGAAAVPYKAGSDYCYVHVMPVPDEDAVDCGCCECAHRARFYGDCRDDGERLFPADGGGYIPATVDALEAV